MGQVERDRDGRHAGRREPLVAEVAVRAEGDALRRKLRVELRDARLERAARYGEGELADPEPENLLVLERRPVGRCRRPLESPCHGRFLYTLLVTGVQSAKPEPAGSLGEEPAPYRAQAKTTNARAGGIATDRHSCVTT